jgi:hypothetical protein
MISKVLPAARSFRVCCRYVCEDQTRAQILKTDGVRGHDPDLMAKDFEFQRSLRPDKHQAVFHSVLSFYPGERPTDKQMVEIAEKYLDRIGMIDTQFVIAKHTDTDHLHMHVIGNRVDNSGQAIDEGWLGLKGKKVAQVLTEEYHLKPALSKNMELTHHQNLQPAEATRYQIYAALMETVGKSEGWADLEQRLSKKGIDTKYKFNAETREAEGISFRLGKQCFKGSQIDREFTLKGLERHFAERELELQQSLYFGLSHSHR